MRATQLLERSTLKAYSRYDERGPVFYISHRPAHGGVLCEAYVALENIFRPAREKVAQTLVIPEGPQIAGANGMNVVPYKSVVEDQYKRFGLYTAMLDHLEAHGYIVHPADGSIGDAALQAQSSEAKAFWAARKQRTRETRLAPASEDEFHGWKQFDRLASLTHIGDLPILEKDGSPPFMTLWKKEYRDSVQEVGLQNVNHGSGRALRLGIWIEMKTGSNAGYGFEDFPLIRSADTEISYFYHNPRMAATVKPTTDKAMRGLYTVLSKIGYSG
ncbi:MAG: hypothetical protein EOO77_43410 [Oxalobacteraceae bacterium]|nr:MAG: hypothetical protein EOO77_43410 [Oxalobacteraceae bacterium]